MRARRVATKRTVAALGLVLAWASCASDMARAADWLTYGRDGQRSNRNAAETLLSTGNVGHLRLLWTRSVGRGGDAGAGFTQPLVATAVPTAAGTVDAVYVASAGGTVTASVAGTGQGIWQRSLPTTPTSCDDIPGGAAGVLGTPTLDRATGRLYAAAGDGKLHTLNWSTGAESGTGIALTTLPATEVSFTAVLQLGTKLYLGLSGLCDRSPYRGRIVEIDTVTKAVTRIWYVIRTAGIFGGGVWGPGGIAATKNGAYLLGATGNALAANEHLGLGERVLLIRVSSGVVASQNPGLIGDDADFGATPLVFTPGGCTTRVAVMSKTGMLLLYNLTHLTLGPVQRIEMADTHRGASGDFIGSPSWDPVSGTLFVGNPSDSRDGPYKHGLVALGVDASCRLTLKWQRVVGDNAAGDNTSSIPPVVANGVVYHTNSKGSTVTAFQAATGVKLWSSGAQISGGIFAPPTVVNGRLYVMSTGGKLYAFGL